MNCPNCGFENNINSIKCEKCGFQLEELSQKKVIDEINYKTNRINKCIFIPISIIMFIIGLYVVIKSKAIVGFALLFLGFISFIVMVFYYDNKKDDE